MAMILPCAFLLMARPGVEDGNVSDSGWRHKQPLARRDRCERKAHPLVMTPCQVSDYTGASFLAGQPS